MATFKGVLERMQGEKEADSTLADALIERLDAHAARRPQIQARAELWIAEQLDSEIDAMDAGLTQFSNALGGNPKGKEEDPEDGSSKS